MTSSIFHSPTLTEVVMLSATMFLPSSPFLISV